MKRSRNRHDSSLLECRGRKSPCNWLLLGGGSFLSSPRVTAPPREVNLGNPKQCLLVLSKLLETLQKENEILIGKFFPTSNLNPAALHSPGDCFQSHRLSWDAQLGTWEQGDRSLMRGTKKPTSQVVFSVCPLAPWGSGGGHRVGGGAGKGGEEKRPPGTTGQGLPSVTFLCPPPGLALPQGARYPVWRGGWDIWQGGSAEGRLPGGGEVEAGRYLPDPSGRETEVCWGTGKEPGRWEEQGVCGGGGACRGPHLRGPVEPALEGRRPPSL